MKERVLLIISVCLAISTLIFALLWQRERNNNEDLTLLAQSSAIEAYTQFMEYQENGETSSYWNGVASFRTFEQAYYLLTENTDKSANYIFCNEVYGYLVLSPEKSQSNITEIIDVMKILSEDIENENAYSQMSELRNILAYE